MFWINEWINVWWIIWILKTHKTEQVARWKASLNWGSWNRDPVRKEFQSPSGKKKESPSNSWKSSQNDDCGKEWGGWQITKLGGLDKQAQSQVVGPVGGLNNFQKILLGN